MCIVRIYNAASQNVTNHGVFHHSSFITKRETKVNVLIIWG